MDTQAKPFELGKNRIEALSDGIFAIVYALLLPFYTLTGRLTPREAPR